MILIELKSRTFLVWKSMKIWIGRLTLTNFHWNYIKISEFSSVWGPICLYKRLELYTFLSSNLISTFRYSPGLFWCHFSSSKKAMRVISSSHNLAHTDPIFMNLGILKLPDLRSLRQLIFFQKYLQWLLRSYIMEFTFPLVHHHPSYPTRNCYKFVEPFCRTERNRKIVKNCLPLLLNSMWPELIEKL